MNLSAPQQLDEGLLERKGTCGDLHKEAHTVAKDCSPESLAQLTERISTLESHYSDVNQHSLERQERCEEALAAMQAFQKKVRREREFNFFVNSLN